MSLSVQQLGPYQILGRLGAGGMGEVYLARDTRLEREVALKVLPRTLSYDREQLARFRREALTLASLNHPNIATVYGFEEPADGPMVLVLERVEGESLSQRLAAGPLAFEEALRICAQIAEALEVAHERGVVHRDMKPSNVMIGPRGLVKVLDFGLAKRTGGLLSLRSPGMPEPGGAPPVAPMADATQSPTLAAGDRAHAADLTQAPTLAPGAPPAPPASTMPPTLPAGTAWSNPPSTTAPPPAKPEPTTAPAPRPEELLTEAGTVMGTPGYMSPEQVLAGEQDERTDVFAFGCVLYECLTGRRAFRGTDAYHAMAAVLADTPDYAALPERTPARLRELLVSCFEKEAAKRLREIHLARIEIEEALGIRRASSLRAGEAQVALHNLPVSATRFVGREAAVRECAALLAGTRLLTLSGMGGSGKTRLALRLAEARLDAHPDGVWFVDLGATLDPERVLDVVAETLGVREESGRSLRDQVVEFLQTRSVLLVLDNCEDVLAACADLATRLLRECPRLRLLATSREPLGVTGEVVFAVPSLETPASDGRFDPVRALSSEAVRLFVDRASLARPDFELDARNPDQVAAVAEICRRLDGIPLAIELAAARVKVLGVEQIRARLIDRFRLLTRGGSAAVPRQQTLLATIQWSWDHLAAREQELMRRLAAFMGGWTLERATAVCEESGDEFEILDVLTRLAEKSLVVVERASGGDARYRFLESVWSFATGRLEESGDGPAVRERHLRVFLALAEESERQLAGPKQAAWIADLDPEQENLLAALAASERVEGGAEQGLRLAGAACRYWSMRGRYELGRRTLEAILARDSGGHGTAARAKALVRLGGFALYQGDNAAAKEPIAASLVIYRELGDRKGVARALSGLGVVAIYQSDHEAAHRIGEESLALYRELGETRGVAQALHNLAYVAWCRKEYEAALRCYEEALVLLRQIGDQDTIAMTLAGLGSANLRLGNAEKARGRFLESLEIIGRRKSEREGAYALEGVAELSLAQGGTRSAARLLGAADAIRRTIGSPAVPGEKAERDALEGRLLRILGPESMANELEAGRTLDLAAALGEANGVLEGG